MALYVDDWDAKTRHLNCELDGAYGRLIRHYWRSGPLPNDDGQLARIVGMDIRRWRKCRSALAPFFLIMQGKWFHQRVEEELQRVADISEKRRTAGRGGGRPPKAKALSAENQLPTHARVIVSSTDRAEEPDRPEEALQEDSKQEESLSAGRPSLRVVP